MIFIFNKSINLQKEIKTSENKTVAFLTGQISIGYGTINSSAQIIDKDYIANNPELFKNEYNAFLNEIRNEAIAFGWEALKDNEVVEKV